MTSKTTIFDSVSSRQDALVRATESIWKTGFDASDDESDALSEVPFPRSGNYTDGR